MMSLSLKYVSHALLPPGIRLIIVIKQIIIIIIIIIIRIQITIITRITLITRITIMQMFIHILRIMMTTLILKR